MRIYVGARTLLAATCRMCGQFKPASEFKRVWRNRRDPRPYWDRRCRKCKWTKMEQVRGRVA